jgi:hypothetical protein
MYYDKSRLLKIELWMRRLAWFFGAFIVIGLLSAVYNSIQLWTDPASLGYYYGMNYDHWIKYWYIAANFRSVLMTVFVFLLLQGAAKCIRYLLALADEMVARYASASRVAE